MPIELVAANACNQTAANVAVGWVIILIVVGLIALFATLNAQARKKLAIANAELAYLRPENERLRATLGSAGIATPSSSPVNPGWYADPTRRHEYRLWDGYTWGEDVSDNGVASKDPMSY